MWNPEEEDLWGGDEGRGGSAALGRDTRMHKAHVSHCAMCDRCAPCMPPEVRSAFTLPAHSGSCACHAVVGRSEQFATWSSPLGGTHPVLPHPLVSYGSGGLQVRCGTINFYWCRAMG